MKQVMGGMDRKANLEYCINKVESSPSTGNADDDFIFISVGTNMCYDAYDAMPS